MVVATVAHNLAPRAWQKEDFPQKLFQKNCSLKQKIAPSKKMPYFKKCPILSRKFFESQVSSERRLNILVKHPAFGIYRGLRPSALRLLSYSVFETFHKLPMKIFFFVCQFAFQTRLIGEYLILCSSQLKNFWY